LPLDYVACIMVLLSLQYNFMFISLVEYLLKNQKD